MRFYWSVGVRENCQCQAEMSEKDTGKKVQKGGARPPSGVQIVSDYGFLEGAVLLLP